MTVEMELNALVAQYVLGHNVIRQKKGGMKERTLQGHIRPLRPYATDISAAWEIVEHLGITLIPIENGMWFAFVGGEERFRTPADFVKSISTSDFTKSGAAAEKTAPLTICLAALKAVEKRLPEEVLVHSASGTAH